MQEIADDIGWIMLLTTREQKLLAGRSEKQAESRRVKYWITALAVLASLSTSIALADDFKTINGKEYKDATIRRGDSRVRAEVDLVNHFGVAVWRAKEAESAA